MSSLNTNQKQILEKLFQMREGYVLNFSDRTMEEFFRDDVDVEIYQDEYNYSSGSKANMIRGFWLKANDELVGFSIVKLIEYIEGQILLGYLKEEDFPKKLLDVGKNIARELLGVSERRGAREVTDNDFLEREFSDIEIEKLNFDDATNIVLRQRIEEINKCLYQKASLSVVFLCGSTLEGILLGVALRNPQLFNESISSPKDDNGNVKSFQNWSLANFIDVAGSLGVIGKDVKKFSHVLRDFRNYIHPYEQLTSEFNPDEHTALICWQVLKAAIFQIYSSKK